MKTLLIILGLLFWVCLTNESKTSSITIEPYLTNSLTENNINITSEDCIITETDISTVTTSNNSIAYNVAHILHNEYCEYLQGKFADWWIDNEELPHLCVNALILDMNNDGKLELISQKYINGTTYTYYTIYDVDSCELLYHSYNSSDGKLYFKDDKYYLSLVSSLHTMAFVTVSDKELPVDLYDELNKDYVEGYFFAGNKVDANIYQYIKDGNLSPYEGTESSYCRFFSSSNGFTYYYGDYNYQLECINNDFNNDIKSCAEIGEIEKLVFNASTDKIMGIYLSQIDIVEYDRIAEILNNKINSSK